MGEGRGRTGDGVHRPGVVEVGDLVLVACGEDGLDGRVWIWVGEDGGGGGGQGGVGVGVGELGDAIGGRGLIRGGYGVGDEVEGGRGGAGGLALGWGVEVGVELGGVGHVGGGGGGGEGVECPHSVNFPPGIRWDSLLWERRAEVGKRTKRDERRSPLQIKNT